MLRRLDRRFEQRFGKLVEFTTSQRRQGSP
jgi:hypothetical protein